MSKIKLGPQTLIYPMPALLVGANVDTKPNFMAVAWGGISNLTPPMVSVAVNHHRHTNTGIKQNKTFSINIPSADLVKEVDFCGIVSGSKVDKVEVCRFEVFYGQLKTAPMIEQCPLNLECSLAHAIDLGSHDLIVGKIEEIHISDNCLTDGKPDAAKINPLIYITGDPPHYQALGKVVARAFSIGLELKK